MKYAVMIASDVMIYIPCLIKIYLGIRKLIGIFTDTQARRHTAWRLHKPNFILSLTVTETNVFIIPHE
jgi:hypothetical protein